MKVPQLITRITSYLHIIPLNTKDLQQEDFKIRVGTPSIIQPSPPTDKKTRYQQWNKPNTCVHYLQAHPARAACGFFIGYNSKIRNVGGSIYLLSGQDYEYARQRYSFAISRSALHSHRDTYNKHDGFLEILYRMGTRGGGRHPLQVKARMAGITLQPASAAGYRRRQTAT